jgi:2-polyprenyl-3-methyl-5-hydroxy-6-metoxy-1,4-benzoquinol methylase
MVEQTELAKYIESVTDRALGGSGVGPLAAGELPSALEGHVAAAEQLVDVGQLEAGTRMAGPKRLLMRLLRLVTFRQTAFNVAATASLRAVSGGQTELAQRVARLEAVVTAAELSAESRHDELLGVVERLRTQVGTRLDEAERRSAETIDGLLQDARSRLDELLETAATSLEDDRRRLNERVAEAVTGLGELSTAHAKTRTELQILRTRVDVLLREARARLGEPMDTDGLVLFARELDGRFDSLYADYEDRFRGSEADIRKRLEVYLPDVQRAGGTGPVVDIGPGRGEWIELLGANGMAAYGVELNEQFAEDCRQRGLDVRVGDAVTHMHQVAPGSLRAVTAFHVMEHLRLDLVVDVIDAALLALEPSGCVIFETPNPTNLTVGAASFYMDPTHQRPLHPQLMEFLMTSRGFCDVELRFLHPGEELRIIEPLENDETSAEIRRILNHLNWALFGPMDYAVIGWKAPVPTG